MVNKILSSSDSMNSEYCCSVVKIGEFWQSPSNHLQGHGCKQCSLERRKKKDYGM